MHSRYLWFFFYIFFLIKLIDQYKLYKWKFTFYGSISVEMAFLKRTNSLMKINVKDSGVGIPEKVKNKLFGAF